MLGLGRHFIRQIQNANRRLQDEDITKRRRKDSQMESSGLSHVSALQ